VQEKNQQDEQVEAGQSDLEARVAIGGEVLGAAGEETDQCAGKTEGDEAEDDGLDGFQ
jgi:hypothetical protein